jgi:Zn-dependent protease
LRLRVLHSQIKLGRIAGIEIGLHYSWFIIAALIAFSLGSYFRQLRPEWGQGAVWGAAVITAVLFFVTLLLHELAHSIVAQSRGLKVRAITLFALGGVSQIESEAPDAKTEFWIAIVGPLTSLGIGFFCIWLSRWSGWMHGTVPENPVSAVSLWLGYINILLAIFNMIPGYPLDGGRVLRSIIWWSNHNQQRATQFAARVGQVVAFLFILYGLFRFFLGANWGGLWLALIGCFLLEASRSSYTQVSWMADLRGRSVRDIMERDCVRIEASMTLRDFVDEHLLHSASRCFLVARDSRVVGLLTPGDLRKINRDEWGQTSVQAVMRPVSELRTVPPEMPAVQALELMARENVRELGVVSNGVLQGVFSQLQVARFLQIYSGMGSAHGKMAA